LNSDGSSDSSFNGNSKLTLDLSGRDDTASDLAIDSNGRLVVAGQAELTSSGNYDFAVIRLNTTGSLDTNFAGAGGRGVAFDLGDNNGDFASGVAIDSLGRIVLAGSAQRATTGDKDFAVARLTGYTVASTATGPVGQF